ncbi:MAG: hypothetical protein JXR48_10105 [Candidatus Delongbacteria bacterium]|nr:hypothetical protein [Candidatus Delongbacteria bacterium]MBN2835307.1 hypothetical protein [Candidatus Delongbacteria bacterium]
MSLNQIKVEEYVCAFIDVLGFKNMITECKEDSKMLNDNLHKVLGALENEIKDLQSDKDFNALDYKVFSDNIFIGIKLWSEYHENEIFDMITTLAKIQLNLALEGIFIRGGVVIDKLYIDERIIFGPGIINSHVLESKISIYPRIILSHEIKDMIEVYSNFYDKEDETPAETLLINDHDDYFYINYLSLLIEDEETLLVIEQKLLDHKNIIEVNLNKFDKDDKIRIKFCWLASYHNNFIQKYRSLLENPEKFKINIK